MPAPSLAKRKVALSQTFFSATGLGYPGKKVVLPEIEDRKEQKADRKISGERPGETFHLAGPFRPGQLMTATKHAWPKDRPVQKTKLMR